MMVKKCEDIIGEEEGALASDKRSSCGLPSWEEIDYAIFSKAI
jgi:hypothetical protein